MANPGEYRLGGMLRFDPSREAHIVNKLNELSDSHRLSQYLMILIRLAFEDPEKIGTTDKLIEDMLKMGMTPCTKEFYDQSRKEISAMYKKIDDIYNMCLEMYTLSKFGKSIGLSEKATNMARAEFMCERQLMQLCDKLGIHERGIFESAKITSIETKSADILEYIINHYDGIVSEIKTEVSPITIEIPTVAGVTNTISDSTNKTNVNKVNSISKDDDSDDDSDNDYELDFGDEKKPEQKIETNFSETSDMSALALMLGGDED